MYRSGSVYLKQFILGANFLQHIKLMGYLTYYLYHATTEDHIRLTTIYTARVRHKTICAESIMYIFRRFYQSHLPRPSLLSLSCLTTLTLMIPATGQSLLDSASLAQTVIHSSVSALNSMKRKTRYGKTLFAAELSPLFGLNLHFLSYKTS